MMNEKERLVQWMQENGYTQTSLAAKTGDVRHSIHYMLGKDRSISQGFKWRFTQAFGPEEAAKVFGVQETAQPVPTP